MRCPKGLRSMGSNDNRWGLLQHVLETSSLVPSRPRRFRMWRHLSSHSRSQSLLGAWARGPGDSGDTIFEVLDFRTSGHFWFSTTFLIAFTCSCRSVNDYKFRWFKAFNFQLTFESEMTGSSLNLGLQILCPQSLLVLVLRSPGGSGDENAVKLLRGRLQRRLCRNGQHSLTSVERRSSSVGSS